MQISTRLQQLQQTPLIWTNFNSNLHTLSPILSACGQPWTEPAPSLPSLSPGLGFAAPILLASLIKMPTLGPIAKHDTWN